MSANIFDLPGDETADGPIEKPPAGEDNTSLRDAILAAMESDDPPEPKEADAENDANGPREATEDADETPKPPQSWTEAERATWADIPEATQSAILRREKEYQAGLRSDAELQKVVAPLAEKLDGTGVHVDEYVNSLVNAHQYIQSNPLGAVADLIKQYNLYDQIAAHFKTSPSQSAPSAPQREDDRIAQLESQIAYQAQLQAATREWDAFTRSHPDAEELSEVIASKIGANPRLTYATAYEEAKELVGKFNGTQAQKVELATVEAGTRAAGKAAKLKLPSGRSSAASPASSSGNLRDDIAAAMRGAGVR